MPGTNSGGDDPLAPTELNGSGSADEPLTPPISDADQRQRDEDRAKLQRLIEMFDSTSPAEAPEPQPYCENDLLPSGWEWREGENGIVLPIPPPPDPNDRQMVFIRFLDHFTETGGQNRRFAPEKIVRIDLGTARALIEMRPFGLPPESFPAKVEFASEAEFQAQEALMPEVSKNEQVTAQDELSQELAREFDSDDSAGPKLIVRFLLPGNYGKRSCSIGEVRPVPKERALRLLRCKVPVVELATPEELKRDRDLVDRIEDSRKRWNQLRVRKEDPLVLVVRFVKPGKNSHGNSCNPGEVWEVDEEFAYGLLRGKSPVCELATDAELKVYRASLTGEPAAVEPTKQIQPGAVDKTVKPKKSTAKGEARTKLIAALTSHHQYSNGGCGEFQPISINGLARKADVAPATALAFFKKQFQGHKNYQRGCGESLPLITVLKLLNDEFTPAILMQHHPTESPPSLIDAKDD